MLASTLMGCAASTPSARSSIDLPAVPTRVTTCARPVVLPSQGLSRAEVERLWARDRAALVKCGYSLDVLVGFYGDLRRRLGAADPSR